MIAPDDPRHGSYAGALQHWKASQPACEPCLAAARRADKIRELARLSGQPPMVPLGDRAYAIVTSTPRNQLRVATGMTTHRLRSYELGGPDMVVRRASRDRILAFKLQWTPIGIQRRLQALSVLGWSMKVLADHTGINVVSLSRIRRKETVQFVRANVADAILTAWEALHEHEAPTSHSSRETAAEAARRGWWPPAAWDNIDDASEDPAAPAPDDAVDEVVVARVLAGHCIPCTPAERVAIIDRAHAAGRSLNSIERQMGWNYSRDRKRAAA